MFVQNFRHGDVTLSVYADEASVLRIDCGIAEKENSNEITMRCCKELEEYFEGARKEFTLPLSPAGTEFQQAVWQALQSIPYGKTVSYSHIAEAVGKPRAVRAVGQAIGRNPVLILIPCHRVVGKNGSLTGFSAELNLKKRLLAREG